MQIRRRQRKHRKKLWTVKRKQQWKSRKKKRTSRIRSRISSSVCCITKSLDNEMDEKYVNSILEDASKTKKADLPFDYLLANIYQKMVLKFGKSEGITPAEDGPRIVWFIGPTGVGKTTTIAKLAGKYCVEDKKRWLSLRQIPIVLRQRSSCGPMPIFWRHLSA